MSTERTTKIAIDRDAAFLGRGPMQNIRLGSAVLFQWEEDGTCYTIKEVEEALQRAYAYGHRDGQGAVRHAIKTALGL